MRLKGLFLRIRNSGKTKDFLVFLIFVAIAAVFWVIMALNDEVQDSYEVRLNIQQVPDSVTFINNPPSRLRVNVRDRGVNLLRHKISGDLVLNLNFEEFADGNKFKISHNSLNASVRRLFGGTATISSVSPDSLSLVFTRLPGRRIPLELAYDVTVAPGMVLAGKPKMSANAVTLYSNSRTDTISRVATDMVSLRHIDKNTTVDVPVSVPAGMRVEPSSVSVTFNVESLVKKQSDIPVEADNIPEGQDILFFPSRVRVTYYVPMSRYSDTDIPIRAQASFNEAVRTESDKVGVRIVDKAPFINNVELLTDSVEYTLVRAN